MKIDYEHEYLKDDMLAKEAKWLEQEHFYEKERQKRLPAKIEIMEPKYDIFELNNKYAVRETDFDGRMLFRHKLHPIWFRQAKKETLFENKEQAKILLNEIRHHRSSLRRAAQERLHHRHGSDS